MVPAPFMVRGGAGAMTIRISLPSAGEVSCSCSRSSAAATTKAPPLRQVTFGGSWSERTFSTCSLRLSRNWLTVTVSNSVYL
jgi:hypothetical protein